MSGKHHYLVVKDIEDVIAKHCAEVTFTRAESQASYATLNVTIVYRTKINDMLNKCFGIIMFYISFVLFFFFFFITSWCKEKLLTFVYSLVQDLGPHLDNYLYFFSPFITTFPNRIRRFYTFPKRKQSLFKFFI